MSSLFSSFYTALRGIQNSQAELQITGQNMTNVNTEGYSRQRVDSYSLGPLGLNMRYAQTGAAVGNGVLAIGTSRVRDPYLDVRYRSENAKLGDASTQLYAMNDIERVLDETNTDGLEAQMKNLISQLQNLSLSPGDTVAESTVKTSASLLLSTLNNYAQQLSSVREQQLSYLKEDAVKQANQLLSNIAYLNEEIRQSDICGNSALELRDQRDMMIDQLSQYANIRVETNSVSVGSGRTVDELTIYFIAGDGSQTALVSNDEYAQFEVESNPGGDPAVELNLNSIDGTVVEMNDLVSSGIFHGYLTMLNDNGEYDSEEVLDPITGLPTGEMTDATSHGIGYYQKCLDTLAAKLAETLNDLNSTTTESKPLFEASDGSSVITAANIAISSQWQNASGSYITSTKQTADSGVDLSNASDNILAMIDAFSTDLDFKTDNGAALFTGTFQEFVTNMSNTSALEIQTIGQKNDTYASTLSAVDTQRQSVSSVDINEEGINLIMYNQALTASSRFMTTLDEAMDTVINRMGIVGR